MRELLRHRANASIASTFLERAKVRSSDRCLRPNSARCRDILRADEGRPVRTRAPSLVVIYDGASVIKNTITAARDTGQTRVVYLRAAEE